jgi:tetratricopeptide (TPR) repeat protein/DNA-binding MarR family transcriptional regulator
MSRKPLGYVKTETKVLLHLLNFFTFRESFEAPIEITQTGIAKGTNIDRSNVPRILKRLKDDGSIYEKSMHITGEHRRKKAYFLTEQGIARAQKAKEALGKAPIEFLKGTPKLKHFFGREDYIEFVKKRLDEGGVVISYGIAGMGKTTLGLKIMSIYKQKRNVFWYKIHEWDALRNVLVSLSKFLSQMNKWQLELYISSKQASESPQIDINEISSILETDLDGTSTLLFFDDYHNAGEEITRFLSLLIEVLEQIHGVNLILIGRKVVPLYCYSKVVVKKTIVEIELKGLDRNSSRKLLSSREINDTEFEYIYKSTKGHPLSLEVIGSLGITKGLSELDRYMGEEFFSLLTNDEAKLLSIISLFRYPVPLKPLLAISNVEYNTIMGLVEKLIISKDEHNNYDIHDIFREFFSKRLHPKAGKEYHKKIAEYYCEHGIDERERIEMQYHFIKAGEHKRAAKLSVENGDKLIREGYSREFLTILVQLHEFEKLSGIENIKLLLLEGDVHYILGEWDKALTCYDRSFEMCNIIGNDLEKAELLRKMGRIKGGRAQWDDAMNCFQESLRVSEKIKDVRGMACALNELGGIYWVRGEYEIALEHAEKSLELAKKINDTLNLAEVYNLLGNIFWDRGLIEKGVECYYKSLMFHEENNNKHGISVAYNNLGSNFYYDEDWGKAIPFFEKQIQLTKEIGYIRLYGYGLTNIAKCYAYKSNIEKARSCLDESIKIFTKLNESKAIGMTYMTYGIICRFEQEWEESVRYFEKSIEIIEKLKLPLELAEIYYEYGKMLGDKGEIEKSKKFFRESLKILKEAGEGGNIVIRGKITQQIDASK